MQNSDKQNAKFDALSDMVSDGFLDRKSIKTSKLTIANIIDPIIQYGFIARRGVYLNVPYRLCNAIGAIVLGLDAEDAYPKRYSDGLMEFLAEHFGVSVNFLEGVEAGFAGQPIFEQCPEHLLNQEIKDGYELGVCAWLNYIQPTLDRI